MTLYLLRPNQYHNIPYPVVISIYYQMRSFVVHVVFSFTSLKIAIYFLVQWRGFKLITLGPYI